MLFETVEPGFQSSFLAVKDVAVSDMFRFVGFSRGFGRRVSETDLEDSQSEELCELFTVVIVFTCLLEHFPVYSL